jgi:hypothetical protein
MRWSPADFWPRKQVIGAGAASPLSTLQKRQPVHRSGVAFVFAALRDVCKVTLVEGILWAVTSPLLHGRSRMRYQRVLCSAG